MSDKQVDFFERQCCPICEGKNFRTIVRQESVPVFQGPVNIGSAAPKGIERVPVVWKGCDDCGAAFIHRLPPTEIVYQGGHATGIGRAWLRHHEAFADFIVSQSPGQRILEIGGGVGTLASLACEQDKSLFWTILEPNPVEDGSTLGDQICYRSGFLEEGLRASEEVDSIVMSHTLEHIYEPRAALASIQSILKPGQAFFLAWPILEDWAEALLAGAFNLEHNFFLSLEALLALTNGFGLELVEKVHHPAMRTYFLKFRHRESGASSDMTMAQPSKSYGTVERYYNRLASLSTTIKDIIKSRTITESRELFMMPASIYSQTLLNLGLADLDISGFLDNAPSKIGKCLFGYNIEIFSPEERLVTAKKPIVILNGGAHTQEISAQLRTLRHDLEIIDVGELANSD